MIADELVGAALFNLRCDEIVNIRYKDNARLCTQKINFWWDERDNADFFPPREKSILAQYRFFLQVALRFALPVVVSLRDVRKFCSCDVVLLG